MNASLIGDLSNASEVSSSPQPSRSSDRRLTWVFAILIALLGIVLRVVPTAGFSGLGFDESLYRSYLLMLDQKGLSGYPEITEAFLKDQRTPESIAKLPPSRVSYIIAGWIVKRAQFGDAAPADIRTPGGLTRDPALVSLERVSSLFSILLFLIAGACAWRMFGAASGLGVLALMACAPVPIHMGQHALIDGYFAFWATLSVWALWECMNSPHRIGWTVIYGASLALMVMTKENAFFIYCALLGIIVSNRWLKWGRVTPRLLASTLLGPLAGTLVLLILAGGVQNLVETYSLLVAKANNLPYAIKTQDGPWHRYLVDMMIVSPIVVCLAIGFAFRVQEQSRGYLYLLVFTVLTYLMMCNVRYAINLRFATIWDLPLCALAFGQLSLISSFFGPYRNIALLAGTAAVCGYELRQYLIFFSDAPLYDLVTEGLLRAVKILK